MKTFLIAAVSLILVFPVFGQNDDEVMTLFGDIESHGGYMGFMMNASQIDGENAVFIGGRTGWIIGHGFGIGIVGGGFFNDYHYNEILMENANLKGGYGGIFMEPIIFPKFPVHLSLPVVMGMGGVTYTSDYYDYYSGDWTNYIEAGDSYMIIEPGFEIELNIVKALRIGFGASYRYTTKLDLDYNNTGLSNDVLNGVTIGASLKLGKF